MKRDDDSANPSDATAASLSGSLQPGARLVVVASSNAPAFARPGASTKRRRSWPRAGPVWVGRCRGGVQPGRAGGHRTQLQNHQRHSHRRHPDLPGVACRCRSRGVGSCRWPWAGLPGKRCLRRLGRCVHVQPGLQGGCGGQPGCLCPGRRVGQRRLPRRRALAGASLATPYTENFSTNLASSPPSAATATPSTPGPAPAAAAAPQKSTVLATPRRPATG